MEKRELVAILMQSPFYFYLRLRERLALMRQHHRRFSQNTEAGQSSPAKKVGLGSAAGTKADKMGTIMVGFMSPENPAAARPNFCR